MKKRILLLGIAVFLLFPLKVMGAAKENDIQLLSQAYCVLDGDTGRVLLEKNGNEKLPNASTTKILTCILALENASLSDRVKISAYATGMPRVHMGVRCGEEYYLKDLLYAMMLESYNDVAVAVAEHVSGSVEGFASLMNDKLSRICDGNAEFVTPNGLDAKGHGISAENLAKLMLYCCMYSKKHEEFLKITGCLSHSFSELTGGRHFTVNNHNALLHGNVVQSGKTGFTAKAGYCYVAKTEIKGHPVYIALLKDGWPPHKDYKFRDVRHIIEELTKRLVLTPLPQIQKKGKKYIYPVVPYKEVLIYPDETINICISLKKPKQGQMKKGHVAGEAKWCIKTTCIHRMSVKYAKSEEKFTILKVLKCWFKKFLLNRIILRDFSLKNCI